MLTQGNPLFTSTEAAVLTRLSVKAVNNAIDRKTVATVSGGAGQATRLLDLRALIALTLERRLADRFVPELRREVFEAVARTSRLAVSLDGGFLRIDLREPRRELATSLWAWRRARLLVTSDSDIMGGEPVFRGTRIPVHLIATLLRGGESEASLRAGYPNLTEAMTGIARMYADAYPLRGRPRARLAQDRQPTQRIRLKMATIAAE